jgi:Bifunctional DNA primase/polymerase, N-terminal
MPLLRLRHLHHRVERGYARGFGALRGMPPTRRMAVQGRSHFHSHDGREIRHANSIDCGATKRGSMNMPPRPMSHQERQAHVAALRARDTLHQPCRNLDVALELASAGIFVFPAIAQWNENAGKLDKKPAIKGWREAATTDPEKIQELWRIFPAAVVGIELGRSGLYVLDLDRHPNSPDGVAAFKTLLGDRPAPKAPMVKTPSDGFHLYFRQPACEPLGNSRGGLPDGVDIRGNGGWSVAPGSSFKQWKWQQVR